MLLVMRVRETEGGRQTYIESERESVTNTLTIMQIVTLESELGTYLNKTQIGFFLVFSIDFSKSCTQNS